jgi:hypothetical protein
MRGSEEIHDMKRELTRQDGNTTHIAEAPAP